ncbi:MAG: DUF3604 domain-containing protein [Deltaproteobacteria bacterium]|nr:DUF3604 domain-containing protein [Deltaproteobacteria bacterium]
MGWMGRALVAVLLLAVAGGAVVWLAGGGVFGSRDGAGEVAPQAISQRTLGAAREAQAQAAAALGEAQARQILFGDLHVHTTVSADAFLFSLPMLTGEGAHPPSDACDFARHCAALDFWSINDHASSISPQAWRDMVSSIRQCNAVASDPLNPDNVAYLGWEWTQVGTTPENHYGHKNVVLRDLEEEKIPARPIAAGRGGIIGGAPSRWQLGLGALSVGGRMHDYARYIAERLDIPHCAEDAHVRDLPANCRESAPTPAELFRKLSEWGHESIVIPHGTTWGFYTPPGSTWRKQLMGKLHDPARQTLLEVYSGHGDSELYRGWRAVHLSEDGAAACPAPRPNYEPTCHRAGEIIRARCLTAGESAAECETRAAQARAHAAAAGVAAHRVVPGLQSAELLDAGQCRDCREPSFNYRPGGSAQFILSVGNFDGGEPRHFRMGFMASSDNHYARPGTGYKEVHRRGFTESQAGDADAPALFALPEEEPAPRSRAFNFDQPGFAIFETERQASFLTTGGLIAAHSQGRDRNAIWDAMQRREVYGTSGPRILLWFDLLNAEGEPAVRMGGETSQSGAPTFRVRAAGSFEQLPGCPGASVSALGPAEIERICKGECYHPSDRRRAITRIEVVKVQQQQSAGEDLSGLIRDPWRVFTCEPNPAGCSATFTDADFPGEGRGAAYYARVFEAPAPAVNAGNLRCRRDGEGNCVETNPCPGPDGARDDCLAPHEPRAWSSPIWVDPPRASSG